MIQFKQIDSQLFELVEPVPLTQDAELPCLVRLIQDDSPMGNRNKSLIIDRIMGKSFTAISMDGYKLQLKEQEICNSHYFYFEIIGIPVADGSAKWALYQMMQGKSIGISDQPNRFLKLVDGIIHDSISDGFWNGKSPSYFIDYAASRGWQIYEPQPAYQVGSAEWAWETALSGVQVKHKSGKARLSVTNTKGGYFIELCHGGICRGFRNDLRDENISAIAKFAINGWELYADKYFDLFEGDFLERDGDKDHWIVIKSEVPDRLKTSRLRDGQIEYWGVDQADQFRKLSPSEVIVDFGCGIKGMIVDITGVVPTIMVMNDDGWIASIMLSALDAPTRELVERLLAQEETNE